MANPVDIIIPVYRGEAETHACLESVLAAAVRAPREIVVVDDASPEPAISGWLRTLEARGDIRLVAHAANRGFVASVNEGMALHPGRDVVLLNSDTEVAPGWLDRLAAHAAGDPTIGTATPFSTNATICSYPRTLVPNAMPAGESTASLDAAFATANAGTSIEIPTAVGFCMFIARRCLDRVGPFDEARYGIGYGEEVDFCMRARRAGFRNVLAADVFVRHVGEVSFGGAGTERRAQAQATVDALYPEFQERLREYLPADPARVLRRKADLERLRRCARPLTLRIGASPEGASSTGDAVEVLSLQPKGGSIVMLRWLREGEEFELWFDLGRDRAALLALLASIGIADVAMDRTQPLASDLVDFANRLSTARTRGAPSRPALRTEWLSRPAEGAHSEAGKPPGAWARLMRRLR